MNDKNKSAWGGSLISRRRMLHYSLTGMTGIAGGFWSLSAFEETHVMNGIKNEGKSMNEFSDLLEKGITFIPFGPPLESPPLSHRDIAKWEGIVNAPFPKQYRDYLLHCNGGKMRISPEHKFTVDAYAFDVTWPHEADDLMPNSLLSKFLLLRELRDFPPNTPVVTLTFEYTYNTWKDSLPPDTFPIAIDPGGNHILIGLKGDNKGKIYFWQIVAANAVETPEIAGYAYLGFIADSFVEFILSLEYIEEE